ncbi:MAG TPA: Clp protease N-terminal domain-containing protein, partial [Pirellulaceae bacterium]|nr:Clp protease N-terminal domain-containing protein [Pirellulaceae bacterium]
MAKDGRLDNSNHSEQYDLMMEPLFTPGAQRAMQMAASLAQQSQASAIEPLHLLWALFLDESRAAEIAAAHGLSHATMRQHLPLTVENISIESISEVAAESLLAQNLTAEPGDELRTVLLEARRQAALLGKNVEVGSEHLLCGLAL